MRAHTAALEAEIEWLRAELHTVRYRREQQWRTIRELRAKIERLRAALEDISKLWSKGHSIQIGEIARRALEEKE